MKIKTLSFFLLFLCQSSFADNIGIVVSTQGEVLKKEGKLFFHELVAGSFVPVNPFSQYKGPDIEQKAQAQFQEKPEPIVAKPGQSITRNSIYVTSPNGYIRFLLEDDSIIDLGPNTIFSFQNFEMNSQERHIRHRLLSGKVRILVVRKLEGRSTYELATPGALVSVRGTDFIVHTELQDGFAAETTVLGVRGQVTVDLARNIKAGEVYHQQVVVNTYSALKVESAEGYAMEFELEDKIEPSRLGALWDIHAPWTDPMATGTGKPLLLSQLPGTGIKRLDRAPILPKVESTGVVAELEKEHPLNQLGGIQSSGNFILPHDITPHLSRINAWMGPYLENLARSPQDRLPYEKLRLSSPLLVPTR